MTMAILIGMMMIGMMMIVTMIIAMNRKETRRSYNILLQNKNITVWDVEKW